MVSDDSSNLVPAECATPSLSVPTRSRARRWRLLSRTALFAVTAVLAVAGCSGPNDPGAVPGAVAATTGQSSPFAHIGAVPKTVSGADFDAALLTGKPVVLWFWAPWCTICRGEAPTVMKIAAEFAGKVKFVGVAGQGTTSAMADFVKQTHTGGMTHLADTQGAVWREYGVAVQPSFAFITRDGRADLRVGSLDEGALRARVAEVAAGATSTVTLPPGQTCSKAADGTLLCGSAGPGQPSTTIPQSPTSAP